MERAIIYSNLKKHEVNPSKLLFEYLDLLKKDIKLFFPQSSLNKTFCPVTNESDTNEIFTIMGLDYRISKSFQNIYLSPRPSYKDLKKFYEKSDARKFWITKLWENTKSARNQKIIIPHLNWVQDFLTQYCNEKKYNIAEYYPVHWGYYLGSKKVFTSYNYQFVNPLFDQLSIMENVDDVQYVTDVDDESLDAVMLFESIDRSVKPINLLNKVKKSMKPGSLCFITCLLSTGFEVQLLGKKSEIFIPPERMNILSYEGLEVLINNIGGFEVLEFSTPGVLDIANVTKKLNILDEMNFFKYIFQKKDNNNLIKSFQNFLQMYCLGTFGRLVLRKK